MKLITTNAKLKLPVPGYRLKGLSLAPQLEARRENMCEHATMCVHFCVLKKVGMQVMRTVREAAVRRTHYLLDKPEAFKRQLRMELDLFEFECHEDGVKALFRPNTASDLDWSWLAHERPHLLMYDYTKWVSRLEWKIPNYQLTYSWNMNSRKHLPAIKQFIKRGGNVAVIVDTPYRKSGNRPIVGALPSHIRLFGRWRRVVDFDRHDGRIRAFDGYGQVGLLRFKGGRNHEHYRRAVAKGDILRQDDPEMFRFDDLPMNHNILN